MWWWWWAHLSLVSVCIPDGMGCLRHGHWSTAISGHTLPQGHHLCPLILYQSSDLIYRNHVWYQNGTGQNIHGPSSNSCYRECLGSLCRGVLLWYWTRLDWRSLGGLCRTQSIKFTASLRNGKTSARKWGRERGSRNAGKHPATQASPVPLACHYEYIYVEGCKGIGSEAHGGVSRIAPNGSPRLFMESNPYKSDFWYRIALFNTFMSTNK